MFVAEDDPGTRDAVAGGFVALATNRLFFVAFYLFLATRHAVKVSRGRKADIERYLPSCS